MSNNNPPSHLDGKGPNYRESVGKKTVIQCRVCSKEMKQQNYGAHSKFVHPQEDYKNLTVKSNKSMFDMLGAQKPSHKRQAPETDDNENENKRIHPIDNLPKDSNPTIDEDEAVGGADQYVAVKQLVAVEQTVDVEQTGLDSGQCCVW